MLQNMTWSDEIPRSPCRMVSHHDHHIIVVALRSGILSSVRIKEIIEPSHAIWHQQAPQNRQQPQQKPKS